MDRREFLMWVGVGSIASSLPLAIAACSPKSTESESKPQSSATASGSTGFQPVGTVSELKQNSQILNKQLAIGPVLVVSNPDNPKTITAVNPTCTHKGCTVEWKANQKAFVCPCHNAHFSADGKVLKGPAKKPLSTYEVKTQGDSIEVKNS